MSTTPNPNLVGLKYSGIPPLLLNIPNVPDDETFLDLAGFYYVKVGTTIQLYIATPTGPLQLDASNSGGGGQGTPITWNTIGASTTLTANNGYFLSNNSSPITLTLPTATVLGSFVVINQLTSGAGFTVTAGAGQTINPSSPHPVTTTSSFSIAPQCPCSIILTFSPNGNIWTAGGYPTTNLPSNILSTPIGQIDFTGQSYPAIPLVGNASMAIADGSIFPNPATAGQFLQNTGSSFAFAPIPSSSPTVVQVPNSTLNPANPNNIYSMNYAGNTAVTFAPSTSWTLGQTVSFFNMNTGTISFVLNAGQFIGIPNVAGSSRPLLTPNIPSGTMGIATASLVGDLITFIYGPPVNTFMCIRGSVSAMFS